ncbi:hypothetical protein ECA3755 [Pectobacterium atrosepticum SCRI1043]|uniref:Uncharacterized protein n=1 Tax=Pectobacterium atrosepticum (strain SCRI 1043 / ATCC BAA-672) TaxID=218491 RepID=Q6D0P3_PECAS|nr:hypothetical protein ECA3755 [Pectobacterium atrosepticum SCRI1043]
MPSVLMTAFRAASDAFPTRHWLSRHPCRSLGVHVLLSIIFYAGKNHRDMRWLGFVSSARSARNIAHLSAITVITPNLPNRLTYFFTYCPYRHRQKVICYNITINLLPMIMTSFYSLSALKRVLLVSLLLALLWLMVGWAVMLP